MKIPDKKKIVRFDKALGIFEALVNDPRIWTHPLDATHELQDLPSQVNYLQERFRLINAVLEGDKEIEDFLAAKLLRDLQKEKNDGPEFTR